MIEWIPVARDELENVACPAESVIVPIVVVPSLNVTVPEGVPAPGAVAVTVAVNVTDWPKVEGFTLDKTVVCVPALFTVSAYAGDALLLSFRSPL